MLLKPIGKTFPLNSFKMALRKFILVAAFSAGTIALAEKKHGHGHGHSHGKKTDYTPLPPPPMPIKQGPPQYTCPTGWELKHTECFKVLTAPFLDSCPIGAPVAGKCVEHTDIIYKCPPGYTAIGASGHGHGHGHGLHSHKKKGETGCYKMHRAPAIRMCGPGFHPSPLQPDMCQTQYSFPPSSYCPLERKKAHRGKHDNGNVDCIDYVSVPPLPTCNKGLVFQGGYCLGTEAYQCEAELLCVGYGCGQGKKEGKHLRRLETETSDSEDETSADSLDSEETSSSPVGGAERRLKKKKTHEILVEVPGKSALCHREIQIDALYQCPPGTIMGNKGHKGKKHGHGHGHGNGLYGQNARHGHHGDKKQESISCYQPVSVDLIQECPSGIYDPKLNACIDEKLQLAEEVCPPNFETCGDKKGKGPIQCCQSDFGVPLAVCPVGYSPEGSFCTRYHPLLRICPPQFNDLNGQCVAKKIKPATQLFNITMCQGKGCNGAGGHSLPLLHH